MDGGVDVCVFYTQFLIPLYVHILGGCVLAHIQHAWTYVIKYLYINLYL